MSIDVKSSDVKGAVIPALTRTALIVGLIVLVATWGKAGQFFLMIAWIGFVAEWIVCEVRALGRNGNLNEANAIIEKPDNEKLEREP